MIVAVSNQLCKYNVLFSAWLIILDYPGDHMQRMNEYQMCYLWEYFHPTPPEIFL